MSLTPEELVWIATVFDCEGCIYLQKQKQRRKDGEIRTYEYVLCCIGHCSLDLITRFHELVGVGTVYTYGQKYAYLYKTERKTVYRWQISKRSEVKEFIALIWGEWLSEYRRETARTLGVAPNAEAHSQDLQTTD